MTQQTILNKTALENLLRRNWTDFVDKTKLIAFILREVRDADLPLNTDKTDIAKNSGVKITLSRIEWTKHGFLVWIEFCVPTSNQMAKLGTCEAILPFNGTILSTNIIGQTIRVK